MYYYCDRIEAGIATFFLVESFQLGLLIQAEITQKTKYAHFYVPVTDKAVLQRLKRRLEALKAS